MISATSFPEQRHLLPLSVIRRERLLPEGTIGEVEAREGDRADLRDIVAHGRRPARFVIIEAAHFFGLKNVDKKPDALRRLLMVEKGTVVEAGQVIAGKSAGRGKRLFSPVNGTVAAIDIEDGRIILQEASEPVELQAGLMGQVIAVREERGVVIETTGAVLQGVWGNNKLMIGTLREAPESGIDALRSDGIDMTYRGAIVITRRPITAQTLRVAAERSMAGVVAPSMPVNLIPAALEVSQAVLLTEGFGALRMSSTITSFLQSLLDKQATLDAYQAETGYARRPELVVNLTARGGLRVQTPMLDIPLQTGMNVRLTRGPYAGSVGQVVHLPKTPYLLENGLRVPCAQVQISTSESAFVPVANLEIFG